MTLFIIIILAALVIVVGIVQIKKAKANHEVQSKSAQETSKHSAVSATPDTSNPGSKPDPNTRNNDDSVLSSGKQG